MATSRTSTQITALTTTTLTGSSTFSSPGASASESTTKLSSQQQSQQEREEGADIYDEIEIEDMTFDKTLQIYHYPCPCGDRFEICIDSLRDGEDIAVCPGCSLMIRVIFDMEDLPEKEGG